MSGLTYHNLISIEGCSLPLLRKTLLSWKRFQKQYYKSNPRLDVYSVDPLNHFIQVEETLGNYPFFLLVNHLQHDSRTNQEYKIAGFTIGKENDIFLGKELLVYPPMKLEESESIFLVTSENEHYTIDMDQGIVALEEPKSFCYPEKEKMEQAKLVDLSQEMIIPEDQEELEKSGAERFSLLVKIAAFVFALSFVFLFFTDEMKFFEIQIFMINFAFFGWFYVDYKILQIDKLYYKCLVVSAIVLLYCFLVNFLFGIFEYQSITFVGIHPMLLLIFQKPMRLIFIKMFKVEPQFYQYRELRNDLYGAILVFGTLIIGVLLFHKFD